MQSDFNLKGQNILVTGGTGFLGSHLLPMLASSGCHISCLCRSSSSQLPAGVARVVGDCQNADAVRMAAQNQQIIIHMAGLLFGSSWRGYLEANSAYARNIALAANNSPSVRCVVFISSLAAAGPCGHAPGKSENMPPHPVSAYGWSKLLAEKILHSELDNGKRLVILRPPIIYGSRDKGLLPLFKSCKHGFGVSPGHFPVSIIHADDCAKSIILACGQNATGIYHLNDGGQHDMDEVCQAMGKAQGKKRVRVLHPPQFFMGASAFLSQTSYSLVSFIRQLLGGKPSRSPGWSWDKFRESAQPGWLGDASRMLSELGFKPSVNLAAGMEEAVKGYRREGWL